MRHESISAILLAAGKGVRFRSRLPKVMHKVIDKPMIYYSVRALLRAGVRDIVIVIGFGAEYVGDYIRGEFGEEGLRFVIQRVQRGTGDAVRVTLPYIKTRKFLLLYGDMPLIDESVINRLIRNYRDAGLVLTSFDAEDPAGYGRIIKDASGNLVRIVEEKDAILSERGIKEVNAGLYMVDTAIVRKYIRRLKNENAQGEYYFPDIFLLAMKDGFTVKIFKSERDYLLGANNRVDLSYLNRILQQRINRDYMLSGVTIINPESVIISPDVTIGEDTVIYPDVSITGSTRIGSGSIIERGVLISDSNVSDNVHIRPYCHIEKAHIGSGAIIGPFARLRPDTVVDREAHIGNFVELKKTRIGRRSKANHLTYLGDADIGSDVNIGAGTITCNYDGKNKYRTVLSNGVFVGSDTQFVAPVSVGKNAYIGAGSTITEDVPPDSLALSRTPQKNIKGWVSRNKRR